MAVVDREASVAGDQSIPTIGRAIVDDARRLVQLEIDLAKNQAIGAAKGAAVAIGLIAAAGLMMLYVIGFAVGALAMWLGLLDRAIGWFLVAGVFFVIAAILVLIGTISLKRSIRRGKATITTIKGDAEWLRQLPTRARSSN